MTLSRSLITVAVLLAGVACTAAADPAGRSAGVATPEPAETSGSTEGRAGGSEKAPVGKQTEAVSSSVRLSEASATRPRQWVAVRQQGRRLHVVAHGNGGTRRLASRATTLGPELDGTITATDVAVSRHLSKVFVGLCCEPVSGAIKSTSLRTRHPLINAGLGHRVDVGGARSLSTSSESAGSVLVGRSGTRDAVKYRKGWSHGLSGVIDVASDPAGGRVAALIDVKKVEASVGSRQEVDDVPGVRVYTAEGGMLDDEFIKLPHRYCWVAFLAADQVALVPDATPRNSRLDCGGDHLDVLDLRSGELHERVVGLAAGAKSVSVDSSGHYLIYTTNGGEVRWRTLDGKGGRLAKGGYLAADW